LDEHSHGVVRGRSGSAVLKSEQNEVSAHTQEVYCHVGGLTVSGFRFHLKTKTMSSGKPHGRNYRQTST